MPWPIARAGINGPNSWIDLQLLAAANYLEGAEGIASATITQNNSTNRPSGSYGWYLDATGKVQSEPPFRQSVGYP